MSEAAPARLRLNRAKGFDLQRLSRLTNRRSAVVVSRPARWGNTWRVGSAMFDPGCAPERGQPAGWRICRTPADAIEAFRTSIDWDPDAPVFLATEEGFLDISGGYGPAHRNRKTARAELAGKNLACWCGLCPDHRAGKPLGVQCAACAPCHADVLLELANAPVCEALPHLDGGAA